MSNIYHIITAEDWEEFQHHQSYKPDSLHQEGFIHCSSYEQVLTTAKRHFSHMNELLILTISEEKVSGILRWESSFQDQLFPHLYGQLKLDQIGEVKRIFADQSGTWRWGE